MTNPQVDDLVGRLAASAAERKRIVAELEATRAAHEATRAADAEKVGERERDRGHARALALCPVEAGKRWERVRERDRGRARALALCPV